METTNKETIMDYYFRDNVAPRSTFTIVTRFGVVICEHTRLKDLANVVPGQFMSRRILWWTCDTLNYWYQYTNHVLIIE